MTANSADTAGRCIALASVLLLAASTATGVMKGDATSITVTGMLVDAPECTINGNNTVDVNFGDTIYISRINTESYRTQVRYDVTCATPVRNALTITIVGQHAEFGSGLIKTDREGLGIQLYEGNRRLAAGEAINFTWPDFPVLYADLVANDGAILHSGDFIGSGSMVISYQ